MLAVEINSPFDEKRLPLIFVVPISIPAM